MILKHNTTAQPGDTESETETCHHDNVILIYVITTYQTETDMSSQHKVIFKHVITNMFQTETETSSQHKVKLKHVITT